MTEFSEKFGVYTNSPTLGQTSLVGSDPSNTSVSFDGVDDHIIIGDVLGFERNDSFSFELLLQSTDNVGRVTLISKFQSPTVPNGYELMLRDGILELSLVNTGGDVDALRVQNSTSLATGEIFHVIVTYDGSSSAGGVSMYINGVKDESLVLWNDVFGFNDWEVDNVEVFFHIPNSWADPRPYPSAPPRDMQAAVKGWCKE